MKVDVGELNDLLEQDQRHKLLMPAGTHSDLGDKPTRKSKVARESRVDLPLASLKGFC